MLLAAFALLERPAGPVLEDFPETITGESQATVACPLPPPAGDDEAAAVAEARALRPAYERQLARSGRTSVGTVTSADGISTAVAAFVRIAEGVDPADAGLPSDPRSVAIDVRAYYEESALALVDHVPAARATEAWFFSETETGRLLRIVQARLTGLGRSDEMLPVGWTPLPEESPA